MQLKKVTHTTIYVNDQEAALVFYRDTLGFKVHTDVSFDGMRWLTLCLPMQPDFEVILMKPTKPESQALVGKQMPEGPLLCIETDDCRGMYEKLKAEGVTFIQDPVEESWGISTLALDLYGNVLGIVQSA